MYRKVRLLNVDVDDVRMDELVETFRQGVIAALNGYTDCSANLGSDGIGTSCISHRSYICSCVR
jgi:hypothetical protein